MEQPKRTTVSLPDMTLKQIDDIKKAKGLRTLTSVLIYCVNEIWTGLQKKG